MGWFLFAVGVSAYGYVCMKLGQIRGREEGYESGYKDGSTSRDSGV